MPQPKPWWTAAALITLLAAVFAAVAPGYIHRYQIPTSSAIGIYCCFLSFVILLVTPATLQLKPKPQLLPLLWCAPYLLYAIGTGDFRILALAKLLLICAPLPLLYALLPVKSPQNFNWQDLVIAIWLITAVLSNQLKNIWTVPANLDFMGRLFLITIASWTWVYIRKIPALGYQFTLSLPTLRAAALNFSLFAILALPAGLALHFIAWNPQWHGPAQFFIDYLGIFLFIALLEELFFRGFLQTLISNSLQSPRNGQIIVAILFGLFHILHAPFPNWKYVLLATVAGWFYGSAYTKAGNLTASALAHAMVDTVWRTIFSKS